MSDSAYLISAFFPTQCHTLLQQVDLLYLAVHMAPGSSGRAFEFHDHKGEESVFKNITYVLCFPGAYNLIEEIGPKKLQRFNIDMRNYGPWQ